jgi:hypothetical protein
VENAMHSGDQGIIGKNNIFYGRKMNFYERVLQKPLFSVKKQSK